MQEKNNKDQLIFLAQKQWSTEDRKKLVALWNEVRGAEMGLIGFNHVRTPCRLRGIVTSLRTFFEEKNDVS